MYHIFLLIALNAIEPQLKQIKEYAGQPTGQLENRVASSTVVTAKSEDVLQQIKDQMNKEQQDLDQMASNDFSTLDAVDSASSPTAKASNNASTSSFTTSGADNTDDFVTDLDNSAGDNSSNNAKAGQATKIASAANQSAKPADNNQLASSNPPANVPDLPETPKTQPDSNKKNIPSTNSSLPPSLEAAINNVGPAQSQSDDKIQAAPKEATKTVSIASPVNQQSVKAEVKQGMEVEKDKQLPVKKAAAPAVAKINVVNRSIKSRKLKQMRKEYEDFYNPKTRKAKNLEYFEEADNIMPRKKAIPKFVSYDIPPELLKREQKGDNRYHPIILSYDEKVGLLFKAIDANKEDDFNAVFAKINEPNARNMRGDTLLTFAVLMQKYGTVLNLLSKGADPDLINGLGYRPLEIAIAIKDYKMVAILVDKGANLNLTDREGYSYLMQAARQNLFEVVDLLISNGANIDRKNNNGETALDIARKYNRPVIVKFLLKKQALAFDND